MVYYRLGDYAQAVKTFQQSLHDSDEAAAGFDLLFLAMCHWRLGDPDEARNCYHRALEWLEGQDATLPLEWRGELKMFRAEAEALMARRP